MEGGHGLLRGAVDEEHLVDESLGAGPGLQKVPPGKMAAVGVDVERSGSFPMAYQVQGCGIPVCDADEELHLGPGRAGIDAVLVSDGVDALLGRLVQERPGGVQVAVLPEQQEGSAPIVPGHGFVPGRQAGPGPIQAHRGALR